MGAIRVKKLFIETGLYDFEIADDGDCIFLRMVNEIPAIVKFSTHEVSKPRKIVVRTFEIPKRGM